MTNPFTFTPAPYPMHGVFRGADGHTAPALLAGWCTDSEGAIAPEFMIPGAKYAQAPYEIAADLVAIRSGFPPEEAAS